MANVWVIINLSGFNSVHLLFLRMLKLSHCGQGGSYQLAFGDFVFLLFPCFIYLFIYIHTYLFSEPLNNARVLTPSDPRS